MRKRSAVLVLLVVPALLAGCAVPQPVLRTPPSMVDDTATLDPLEALPPPGEPIVVAVYDFPDLTGQYKATETVTTYSRAVTQGGIWVVIDALERTGGGRWFRVIERRNLDHVLRERQIIREMNQRYAGAEGPVLPPLLYAGVIVEGGIVGYDTNTVTGGLGARYLGIGGNVEYRQDTVTVSLAIVSVKTGEVLDTVMVRKAVASFAVAAGVFKFVSFRRLLEAETGFTTNEPGLIAVREAIEHAIRALVVRGAEKGFWAFADPQAGRRAIAAFRSEEARLKGLAGELPEGATPRPAGSSNPHPAPAGADVTRGGRPPTAAADPGGVSRGRRSLTMRRMLSTSVSVVAVGLATGQAIGGTAIIVDEGTENTAVIVQNILDASYGHPDNWAKIEQLASTAFALGEFEFFNFGSTRVGGTANEATITQLTVRQPARAYIVQSGSSDSAEISQWDGNTYEEWVEAGGNEAVIDQDRPANADNESGISQEGYGLWARITPVGSGNHAEIDQRGAVQVAEIRQEGSGNQASISMEGTVLDAHIDQNGSGNVAEIDVAQGIGSSAYITQNGTGNRASIGQGPVDPFMTPATPGSVATITQNGNDGVAEILQ